MSPGEGIQLTWLVHPQSRPITTGRDTRPVTCHSGYAIRKVQREERKPHPKV